MNITKIISLLDRLRADATRGNCDQDATYLLTLHNNYEALRQAALDGERYRKEAEKLHSLCSKLTPGKCDEAEKAMEAIIQQAKAGEVLAEVIEDEFNEKRFYLTKKERGGLWNYVGDPIHPNTTFDVGLIEIEIGEIRVDEFCRPYVVRKVSKS